MQLQEGQRITAPFLPDVAEVLRFEHRRGYCLLQVVLQDGARTYRSLNITADQLATVQVVSTGQVALAEDAEDLFFFVEANRIRLAYQFDPHLAISVSQVDPLPHQIEAMGMPSERFAATRPHSWRAARPFAKTARTGERNKLGKEKTKTTSGVVAPAAQACAR
jgi:hypothetical protein